MNFIISLLGISRITDYYFFHGLWLISLEKFFARMPSSAHILLYRKIGISGFEPKTPWTQTKCSAKLSYIPWLLP